MNYLLLIRIAFMVIIMIIGLGILINSKATIYLPHPALWTKLLILILIPGIPPL